MAKKRKKPKHPPTPDVPTYHVRCECRGECGTHHPGGACSAPDGFQVRFNRGPRGMGRWSQPHGGDKKKAPKPVTVRVVDGQCQECRGGVM